MKSLPEYLGNTQCYIISAGITSFFTAVYNFLVENTPKEIFGLSLSIWIILLLINLWDVKTGVKANKIIRANQGVRFTFESRKGWRIPEKIGLFTLIIGFAYYFEQEMIRYHFPEFLSVAILWFKVFFSFYIALLEFQSIGENHEVIYGYKSKPFHLLDQIIVVVDDGVLNKIKSFFNTNTESDG